MPDPAEQAFEASRSAWADAARAVPDQVGELHLGMAGTRAHVRIVGAALAASMGRVFGHLVVPDDGKAPGLTIELWDTAARGVAWPAAERDLSGKWHAWGGVLTSFADGRFVRHERPCSIAWLDRQSERLVGSTAAADELSLYEIGKPLPVPLALWHNDRGRQLLHAGMVACDGAGVLFVGNSGSGKSTCSLACAEGGLQYLGDDYMVMEQTGDGSFVGHSLYASSFLSPSHLQRFPGLAAVARSPHGVPGDDKSLVVLDRSRGGLAGSAPVCAIVVPRITGSGEARILRVPRGEALRALAPSSLFMLPLGGGNTGFQALADLVAAVPAYRLEIGAGVDDIPARVREVLAP